jgi:aldose 1-epimerase
VTTPIPPSGQQHAIRHGDQVAVVTEVGATLRSYIVGGRDILDGFGVDEVCSAGRGQHLLPWPNRIRGGRYSFEGRALQLALSEPANGNAIHGLTRWVNWSDIESGESVVSLGYVLHPQPGWPGSLDLTVTTSLSADGLRVTTTAVNVGSVAVPYAAGSHPYLSLGAARVDGLVLTLPAATVLLPDERGIPVGPHPVDGTAYDFRTPRAIGDLVLDTAYRDLAVDADGVWEVHLSDETGSAATLWADSTHPWMQVFTGDTLPAGRARGGLAIEPMTAGPDAFNTGDGLVVLAPGERHQSTWGIRPS